MSDITFDLDGTTINLRVGALIRHENHVLLCRLPGADWWYVPGGRVTTGESTRDALHREMQEEVVGQYSIHHPAICSENFFRSNGRTHHEICIYYTVVWESDRADLKTLSHEEFRWIGLDQLENYLIKPSFLKERLGSPTTALEYVIHRDI